MFFSTELLSRRDSGYGLLWLAATLGSKSKKLPRRSVLTADIQQLCGLISEPPEPLALRLSSNLMVGVVRVYKLKHEIFHTDVSHCFTSLKKTLQELHSTGGPGLDMAQPNGLREDALNMVPEPGMAMLAEFDGNDMDWDIIFRKTVEEPFHVVDDEEFDPDTLAKSSSFGPTKRKLHQLDESHEHLFSASFLNSLSGEAEAAGLGNDGPSSSANDALFNLDFGADPDIGLGEEMERELAEAWNLKPMGSGDEVVAPVKEFEFEDAPRVLDQGFGGDFDGGMDFGDDVFGAGLEQNQGFDHRGAIPEHEEDNNGINPNWMAGSDVLHTPPPHDKAPSRSCLSRRSPASQPAEGTANGDVKTHAESEKTKGSKKPRKKVTLVDPRIELTDEQLKFQRDNYFNEMKRLRRDAQKKKELKEGKRKFEELLWAPPKDFVAPELIEWYNQRVVYPVKVREAAWRQELEELANPKKKRRIEKDFPEELDEEPVLILGPQDQGVQDLEIPVYDFPMDVDMEHMGGFEDGARMDAFDNPMPQQEDPQSGSRRSSDSPGQPRRGAPRPLSRRSSILDHSAISLGKSDPVSNSLFPWDHTDPSSPNAALPGSFDMGSGGSGLVLSMDSAVVRLKRSSRSGSASDSPLGHTGSQPLDLGDSNMLDIDGSRMDFDAVASMGDANLMETQESESMVTLEKNSFNFLGYAKMHTLSNSESKTLYFSDLVPTDSSSARVAAEGFYHCLALATKDLIRLEQKEAYGPIKIQIK